MRSSWIIQVTPKSNGKCPCETETDRETRRWGEEFHGHSPGSWKRRERLSAWVSGRSVAPPTPWFWTCGLQNSQRTSFCCFRPRRLRTFADLCYHSSRKLIQTPNKADWGRPGAGRISRFVQAYSPQGRGDRAPSPPHGNHAESALPQLPATVWARSGCWFLLSAKHLTSDY